MSQSNSPDHCVKLSDPSLDCTDAEEYVPDNLCFHCINMHEKLVELRGLERQYTAAKAGQGRNHVILMKILPQRIIKVDQQYKELADRRERVFENSRKWPIDHALMYAGTALARFKQDCRELAPLVADNID